MVCSDNGITDICTTATELGGLILGGFQTKNCAGEQYRLFLSTKTKIDWCLPLHWCRKICRISLRVRS